MNKLKTSVIFAAVVSSLLLMSGCTQLPTEKRSVADIRPQISFKTTSEVTKTANVLVDGLVIGTVGNFIDGVAVIRVLPGTHLLTVMQGNQLIFEEKFYAGDGVSRSFVLN